MRCQPIPGKLDLVRKLGGLLFMLGFLSTPWLLYLGLKYRMIGLSELQRLVYENHKDDKQHAALDTYLRMLAYEAEVEAAMTQATGGGSPPGSTADIAALPVENKANAEKEAYLGISRALHDKDNLAGHNTSLKAGLHLFGLLIVSMLMVGIAASNTMSLMDFLKSEAITFGPYTYLFMAFAYTCSFAAQWMIFHKTVPAMMRALLSFSRGWFKSDMMDARVVTLVKNADNKYALTFESMQGAADNGADNAGPLPGDRSRAQRLVFFTFCTALMAMGWGVLVYNKISTGFSREDGLLGLSDQDANAWGWLFGVGAGVCAFLLWSSTLRRELKEEERRERKNELVEENRGTITNIMIAVTCYGLVGSVLSQTRGVFGTFGWDGGEENLLNPDAVGPGVMAAFLMFAALSYLGRHKFNVEAMANLCELARTTYEKVTSQPEKRQAEWEYYSHRYMLGGGLVASVMALGVASFFFEQLQKPLLDDGPNGHAIMTPLGLAALASVLLWFTFLMGERQRYKTYREADETEKSHALESTLFYKRGVHRNIRKKCEDRTGQQVFAALINALAFGAIGGSGMRYAGESLGSPEWMTSTLAFMAMAALAAQSFSAANYAMRLDDKKGSPNR